MPSATHRCVTREELHREFAGEAVRQMLDASPASSLPLSYLVEILSERDAHLLDELRAVGRNQASRTAFRRIPRGANPRQGPGIMFALRGVAVSFSVFLLVYCVLSIAVAIVMADFLAASSPVFRAPDRGPAVRVATFPASFRSSYYGRIHRAFVSAARAACYR